MISLRKFEKIDIDFERKIESPCNGVTLIDYCSGYHGPALHLLISTRTKPPLDIAFSLEDHTLLGLQFVLQDEEPTKQYGNVLADIIVEGVPSFSYEVWPDASTRYWDVTAAVSCVWYSAEGMLITFNTSNSKVLTTECKINSELSLFFDNANMLSAISIAKISEIEKNEIRKAKR